jgi:hypothetical protein
VSVTSTRPPITDTELSTVFRQHTDRADEGEALQPAEPLDYATAIAGTGGEGHNWVANPAAAAESGAVATCRSSPGDKLRQNASGGQEGVERIVPPSDLAQPPGGLTLAASGGTDPATIAAADFAARHWRDPQAGALRPGSEAHKLAVTRMFRETFNPYKPSIIDWPKLGQAERDRLVTLPIWDIAVQTEGKARIRMLSYARSLSDPAWYEAIELNGWEEGRHKTVLSNLVEAYGITLEPEPDYAPPRHVEWAYLVTGFSECIDSFFAFGLFALAKQSGFFPPELVETFEPVMQEECRHILLFANWVAAHRAAMAWWRRPWFELQVWAVWVFLGWERMGIARGMDDGVGRGGSVQDNNFTVTGSKAVSNVDVSIRELMELCLIENDRRFAGYDPRLRRPTTMPWLVRMARRFMPKPKTAAA